MRATPVRSTIALLFALAISLSALAACSSDGSDGAGSSTTTSAAKGSEPGAGKGTNGASPLADRFEAIPAAEVEGPVTGGTYDVPYLGMPEDWH